MLLDTNILVIALLILMLIVIVDTICLRLKLRKILRCETKDIGDALISIDRDVKALKNFRKETEKYCSGVEERLKRSIQSLETVRFNAFRGDGSGGNQSFASALLSEKGDGVVFSSMYSRDRVSIFAKPVANFKSEYDLSDEESGALSKAKEKVSK